MGKINFCGDSFCRKGGYGVLRHSELAWTTLLAEKLKHSIIGLGKAGSAHEHAIKSFNPTADINVFCWTEPHRLYHDSYPISMGTAEANKDINVVYDAAYKYYKYLHSQTLALKRYERDLYWFDQAILKHYAGLAIHLVSFSWVYEFEHGLEFSTPLNDLRTNPYKKSKDEIANHLNKKQNQFLADELYTLILDAKNNKRIL